MESFESVWKLSAENFWSYVYPLVIFVGMTALVGLSFVKRPILRRTLMILASLGFAVAATLVAFKSISTKWQIRSDWVQINWDSLTNRQQEMAMADGANLVLGPPIYGVFALICLVLTMILSSIVRRVWNRKVNIQCTPDG